MLLHFATTHVAGPTSNPYGCIDCGNQGGDWLGAVGFASYFLLSFIIPVHLGKIKGRSLRGRGAMAPLAGLKALACAAPVWLCAILSVRNLSGGNAILWWLAGVGYLTAGLNFVSGIRSTHDDPPRITAYAGTALTLASHICFLSFGWSLTLGLCLTLIVSAILDTGQGAREQLPASWNGVHLTYSVGALFGALLLIPGGPSWIG